MDDLEFGALTNDQLIGLLRALLQECVNRGAAVVAAAQAAGLDEAEKARIIKEAAEREAAILRAKERERVAREAAEQVRQQAEAQAAIGAAERAKAAALASVQAAEAKERRQKGWLIRAAALLDRSPCEITICCLHDRYYNPSSTKTRVIINKGGDSRYDRKHLVDYSGERNTIKVSGSLVGKRAALLAFCAELAASPEGVLAGATFDFSEGEKCPVS